MSNRLFPDDILFSQRLLSCCGLYSGGLNGKWDKATDDADQAYLAKCDAIAAAHGGPLDARSEGNIRTLLTEVQPFARESLRKIRAAGLDARIISGTRTYPEQHALFLKRPRVTKADAGQSWHNFGRAWDVGIFKAGKYLADGPEYAQAASHGKIPGVEWGGDWKSFKDKPHYQVIGDFKTLDAVRKSFESGGRCGGGVPLLFS